MKTLFLKDCRINRLVLAVGLVCLLAPYAGAPIITAQSPAWESAPAAVAWGLAATIAAYFSLMCSQATLAMLCGNIIACERADRSAEFLAYLPPSKGAVLASKAAVIGAVAAVIWGLNLCVYLAATHWGGEANQAAAFVEQMPSIWRFAAIGLAAGGAGWLGSSLLESAGPAVALAMLAPLAIIAVLNLLRYFAGWPTAEDLAFWFDSACVVVGVGGFAAGTIYYLRRVEP